MTTEMTIVPPPPNIPRWNGYEESEPLQETPELFKFEAEGALPKMHTPQSSRWLFVVLFTMKSGDPFLSNYLGSLKERGELLRAVEKETLPLLEEERNGYKKLVGVAERALEVFKRSKPQSEQLKRVIDYTMYGDPDPDKGYKGYVHLTKQSRRELFLQERAKLVKLVQAAKALTLLEEDKKLLQRMGYINPFVLDACLQGFMHSNYEFLAMIQRIEGVWRERNAAVKMFESHWDCLKYTLERVVYRRVVPEHDLWRTWSGYMCKEPDRDIRQDEKEKDSGLEFPASPPKPVHWLAVSGKMWRLYWVRRVLEELEKNPEGRKKEIEECRAYEKLLEGHNQVVAMDEELLSSALDLRNETEAARATFYKLTTEMEAVSESIPKIAGTPEGRKKNWFDLQRIRVETVPGFRQKHDQESERTLKMADTLVTITHKLEHYIAAYSPVYDPERLARSLTILGFATASGFMAAHKSMEERHRKATEWKTSLQEEWAKLETQKHETRIAYDYLASTVENDFVPPGSISFYTKRIILGVSPIDRDEEVILIPQGNRIPYDLDDDDPDEGLDLQYSEGDVTDVATNDDSSAVDSQFYLIDADEEDQAGIAARVTAVYINLEDAPVAASSNSEGHPKADVQPVITTHGSKVSNDDDDGD